MAEQHSVEIFENNEWVKHSWHKDLDIAIINADVAHNSRKLPVRIITGGKIIYKKGEGNGLE